MPVGGAHLIATLSLGRVAPFMGQVLVSCVDGKGVAVEQGIQIRGGDDLSPTHCLDDAHHSVVSTRYPPSPSGISAAMQRQLTLEVVEAGDDKRTEEAPGSVLQAEILTDTETTSETDLGDSIFAPKRFP